MLALTGYSRLTLAIPPSFIRLLGGSACLDLRHTTPSHSELSWGDWFLPWRPPASSPWNAVPNFSLYLNRISLGSRRIAREARRLSASTSQGPDGPCIESIRLLRIWVEPINEILRYTEGHDDLISKPGAGAWNLSRAEGAWIGVGCDCPARRRSLSPRVQRPSPNLRQPPMRTLFLRQVPAPIAARCVPCRLAETAAKGRYLCAQHLLRMAMLDATI